MDHDRLMESLEPGNGVAGWSRQVCQEQQPGCRPLSWLENLRKSG